MCVIESFICMGIRILVEPRPSFLSFEYLQHPMTHKAVFKVSRVHLYNFTVALAFITLWGVASINIALASHRNMSTIGFFPRSAGGSLGFDWLVIFSVSMPKKLLFSGSSSQLIYPITLAICCIDLNINCSLVKHSD